MATATKKFVGIGDIVISSSADDCLCAANLGSCLGVVAFDPVSETGGMVHCLLPLSKSDPEKAKARPGMYVDTGVTTLLEKLFRKGVQKKDLIIAVAGGSAINDTKGVFEIGNRNFTVLRKLLWKNNLLLKAEDIGGDCSRTVSLFLGSGEVWVKKRGELLQLL